MTPIEPAFQETSPIGAATHGETVEGVSATGSGLVAVTHSTIAAEALMAPIQRAYAIGTPVTCQLLRHGSNDTYLVTTRDGRYIARVYGVARRLPEICYELELLAHLAAKGVSVAVPIPDRAGRLTLPLAAPEGTRRLVLFAHADGKPLTWSNEEHSRLAGRTAAIIHAASDDFESRHARPAMDLGYLIDRPLAAIQPFLAGRPDDSEYLRVFAAKLRARISEAARTGLDWGVCHGDLSVGNILIGEADTLVVLDFDSCGPGWRAYDFAAPQWIAKYHPESALWSSFLAGYAGARQLSPADLAVLPLFRAIGPLVYLGILADNVASWGTLLIGDTLNKELAFFRRWEAEHQEAE